MLLRVRLTPRGGADRIEGETPDASGRPLLRVRVSPPASGGAANAALVALVAKALGTPRTSVEVRSGHSSRVKTLFVRGEGLPGRVRALLA